MATQSKNIYLFIGMYSYCKFVITRYRVQLVYSAARRNTLSLLLSHSLIITRSFCLLASSKHKSHYSEPKSLIQVCINERVDTLLENGKSMNVLRHIE